MELERKLAALEDLSSSELRDAWRHLTGEAPPRISPKLLRHALAYELQTRALGGLPRGVQQALDQFATARTRTMSAGPGTRLVREWQGKVHVVTIGEDKLIRWEEREYRSLSQVAKAITGTHWSGPAFFGLKKRLAA
jgi:hypothetical protein